MNAVMIETPQQGARRLAAKAIARDGMRPVALHDYRNADGTPAYWRIRCKHPETGDKWMRPMRWDGSAYVLGEPPAPETGKLLYRLPEVLSDPTAVVWIVEGEACVEALEKAGKVATTSGSASSADSADWEPLRGRSVIVWPDSNGPGKDYADNVVSRLRALGCDIRTVDVDALALPVGGDVVDWLADHSVEELDALPMIEPAPSSALLAQERAPLRLPDPLPSVPSFEPALLPESLRAWCVDAAEGLQVPLDFTAIPAMVALAGAVGGRGIAVRLKMNGHWYARPVLWGCVIGRPSSGKSPALSPARRMLERLADAERAIFESEMHRFLERAMLADASKANAKEAMRTALKKGRASDAEAVAASAVQVGERPPSEPRIIVNDATVEKLGELLNANPRGLVQYRDELAGWLATLDREGREGDRAFWLECWNGSGQFTVDRIGRGTVRIEACAVSILGGMQPGKLAEYVRGAIRGGFADDGMMQRFQLAVFPDLPASWRYTDARPNPDAERVAWETFKRLRSLRPDAIGAERDEGCDVPFLRLSADAQEMFIEWQTELMMRLRAGAEPAWMESHLSKFPELAGRLALVLHLADGIGGNVTGDSMARALGWCEYLEGHARRIYSPATDNGLTAAHLLLRKRGDLPDGFSARDVYRKQWAGLSDPSAVTDALDTLAEYGHVVEFIEETGGRPATKYRWAT